jgi:hypothetical protein
MLIEKNEFGVKPPTEQIKHEERLRGIKYKWSSYSLEKFNLFSGNSCGIHHRFCPWPGLV